MDYDGRKYKPVMLFAVVDMGPSGDPVCSFLVSEFGEFHCDVKELFWYMQT